MPDPTTEGMRLDQIERARREKQRADEACPSATAAEERSIALPLYPGLSDAEQDQVIAALHAV